MKRTSLVFLLLSIAQFSQAQSFTEIAQTSGIDHRHLSKNYMGGGVAFFDYNNDGYDDIYLTGGEGPDRLYKNLGDGTFIETTKEAGIDSLSTITSRGVVTGDIDNDGFRDIFVACQQDANVLYHNNGDGTFTDISTSSQIDVLNAFSMGASMGDFNLDGYLDIYVINYIKVFDADQNGYYHECSNDWLYINNKDNTFTEVGNSTNANNDGCSLASTFTDHNQDGRPDIYIANDFGAWVRPNVLYQNTAIDTFKDVSSTSATDVAIYGMGIATGDYNKDGLFDYYVTNLGRNVLLKGTPSGVYADVTDLAGVPNEFTEAPAKSVGWGTVFFDYDHDGFEDLFVANGYVPSNASIGNGTTLLDPNKLYRNNTDDTFTDVSLAMGVSDSNYSRGMAVADIDNDGDLDILATILNANDTETSRVRLYRNDVSSGNYLQVKLQGTASNRDAYGAKAKAYKNGEIWLREVAGGSSHVSQNTSTIHFGMAGYDSFDSLEIIWNGGKKQTFYQIEHNQTIKIIEDSPNYSIEKCQQGTCLTYSNELPAPSILTASFDSASFKNTLTWNYTGDPLIQYIIEKSDTTKNYMPIDTVDYGINSYMDIDLDTNKTYYYRLRVFSLLRTSPYSAEVSVFTKYTKSIDNTPILVAPTNLSISFDSTKVENTLNWQYTGLTNIQFIIEKSDTSKVFQPIDTVSYGTTSFIDAAIDTNQTYYYRLQTTNFQQYSPYSNEVSIFTRFMVDQPDPDPTALEDSELSKRTILYPNPADQRILLSLPPKVILKQVYDISFIDSSGKRHTMLFTQKGQTLDINISALPPGIYMVFVHTQLGPIVKRAIIN